MSSKSEKAPASLSTIGNYVLIKTLGEGNFAKVKLAKHKITGQEVAIKIIDKSSLDEKKLSKLYREVRIMKLLHHPNIVKLYEVIETKHTIYLVMEYVSGGELYDYLVVHGRMKEKEARAKFRQILNAVSYCHKKRVIHRDLKAENLLLDSNLNVKIADFGFSNNFDPDGKLDTFCGSPPYAAPELFQGKRYTGPEVDVWSLGVILYVLSTGCLPFDGKNLQEMRESVCRGKYRIPFYLSEGCEKLLRKLLVRDPTKRPSLEMLVDDEWLNEGFDSTCICQDLHEQLVGEDFLIISIMESKFGLDKESVIRNLRENVYDDSMAIYYLLWDEKVRNGDAAVIKIGEAMAIKNFSAVVAAAQQKNAAEAALHPPPVQVASPSTTLPRVVHTPTIAAIKEEGSSGTSPTGSSSGSGAKISKSGSKDDETARNNTPVDGNAEFKVRSQRRATIMGDSDIQKMAVKEDALLMDKLKELRINENAGNTEALNNQEKFAQSDAAAMLKRPSSSAKVRPMSMAAGATNSADSDADSSQVPSLENSSKDSSAIAPDSPKKSDSMSRKRGNTITGFFKILTSPKEDQSPQNGSQESIDAQTQAQTMQNSNEQPRSLRFTFNSNTTSLKPPDEIIKDVIQACMANQFQYKLVSRFLVECVHIPSNINEMPNVEPVKVEIEVCRLPRLKNTHGLRFKRVGGASADYKAVCEKLLEQMKL